MYELLDGYNSDIDMLDSDDEEVPNELHRMNEEDTKYISVISQYSHNNYNNNLYN